MRRHCFMFGVTWCVYLYKIERLLSKYRFDLMALEDVGDMCFHRFLFVFFVYLLISSYHHAQRSIKCISTKLRISINICRIINGCMKWKGKKKTAHTHEHWTAATQNDDIFSFRSNNKWPEKSANATNKRGRRRRMKQIRNCYARNAWIIYRSFKIFEKKREKTRWHTHTHTYRASPKI